MDQKPILSLKVLFTYYVNNTFRDKMAHEKKDYVVLIQICASKIILLAEKSSALYDYTSSEGPPLLIKHIDPLK